jgi:hypothetical protein
MISCFQKLILQSVVLGKLSIRVPGIHDRYKFHETNKSTGVEIEGTVAIDFDMFLIYTA